MFKSAKSTFFTFLIVSLTILLFGDIMVFSASQVTGLTSGGSSFAISWKQILLSIAALPIAWVIAHIPLKSMKLIANIGLFLAVGIMLLLIPFGRSINGNRNWIAFGPIDLQPSEFAKLFLIIWSSLIISKNLKTPRKIFTYLMSGFAAVLAIVLAGGDLGSSVVMGLILASILYLSGVEKIHMTLLAVLGITGVAGLVAIQPYRIARFTAFIHPFANGIYKNAGWQPAHSLMALGTGGLFGSGLGSSMQKWGNLAEAHTDFIFAVIGEELGLAGTIFTLVLISLLVISIFKISLSARDDFSRFAGLGIGCWIGFQSIINLMSATSLIPVVGVTLPFISYGGSSLLALVGALGFVAGIALRDSAVSNEINTMWPLNVARSRN